MLPAPPAVRLSIVAQIQKPLPPAACTSPTRSSSSPAACTGPSAAGPLGERAGAAAPEELAHGGGIAWSFRARHGGSRSRHGRHLPARSGPRPGLRVPARPRSGGRSRCPGRTAGKQVEGDLGGKKRRLLRFGQRQQRAALFEQRVDAGAPSSDAGRTAVAIGPAQPEGAQRREQPRQPDGRRGGREQPVVAEPENSSTPATAGNPSSVVPACEATMARPPGGTRASACRSSDDLAAENGEIDAIEAALFDPGDESRAVEPSRSRYRPSTRRARRGGDPYTDPSAGRGARRPLCRQRNRMNQRDAAQVAPASAGGGGSARPNRTRFRSQ